MELARRSPQPRQEITVPTLFFRSLLLLALLLSGSLATAAEKRELSVDPQILAQAKQIDGRNPAALRALFGLSQREDLRETRSLTDRNGATHSRYRQTLQGIPVWAEEIVISRNPSVCTALW
jgi:Zn-dependent metalloprotease